MQMNTTDLEERLPHNKRSESVFSRHHHLCYDIYYKGQWLSYLPYVQVPGTVSGVTNTQESLNQWMNGLLS